jgi:hypothetical protein
MRVQPIFNDIFAELAYRLLPKRRVKTALFNRAVTNKPRRRQLDRLGTGIATSPPNAGYVSESPNADDQGGDGQSIG